MVKKSDIKQMLKGIKIVDTTRDRIYNDLKYGEDIVYVFDNGLHIAIKDNDYIYSYFLDYREKENCIYNQVEDWEGIPIKLLQKLTLKGWLVAKDKQ